MSNLIQSYTYTGSFPLKFENTILGDINYVEDITNHRKLYRAADFVRALKLQKNFVHTIVSRHRFPKMRHCWCDWISLKSALKNIPRPSNQVIDICSRTKPEETSLPVKIVKKNKIISFILELPEKKIIEALFSFDIASKDFGAWIKRFGGNPDDYHFTDLEEFSATDFVDLLKSYKLKLIPEKGISNPKQEASTVPVELKTLEGKNIQITLNIKLD